MRTQLLRLALALFMVNGAASSAIAQVFIPDTNMRNALNYYIPGVVDIGGIMDTVHPGIASLGVFQTPDIPLGSLDLTGIEYLDSLEHLIIGLEQMAPVFEMTWAPWPPNLKYLDIASGCTPVTIPQVPENLTGLSFFGPGCPTGIPTTTITEMPDSLGGLVLFGDVNVVWSGTGYIGGISIELGVNSTNVIISPIEAGRIDIIADMPFTGLDMSAVDCQHVYFNRGFANDGFIWPQTMEELVVGYGSTGVVRGSLGIMPSTLLRLDLYSTYVCVPFLPEGLTELTIDPMTGCIPNWPVSLTSFSGPSDWTQETVPYCSVLNNTCSGIYPGISGRVFMDADADGQYDMGEPALPQVMINLQPGDQTIGSNNDGYWETGVQPGTYTITPSSSYPYVTAYAPAQHTGDVPAMGDSDTGNDFAAILIPNIQDLRVQFYADPTRPGFDNRIYFSCQNYGTIPVDADVMLTYDADQTWVASSITPDTQSGNSATWNLLGLGIGETQHFTVDLTTATTVPLGTSIIHNLTADPVATDETPLNNEYMFTDSVVGSYDPNDKTASPAVMSPSEVQAGNTPIEYTIRFQNTGTYLAERVVILDTLSEDLQWESMRFIASSHPNHWYVTDGVLHVIHNDILLPDSTSDEAGSHGFIKFSMLPATDLQGGATISNIAHIVFDFNEPIITPPAVFSVDVEAGVLAHATEQLRVYPNPATDLLRVEFPSGTFHGTNYVLRDVLGKEVLRGRLNGSKQVTISGLEDGSYTIELTGKETRSVARFVKQ